MKYLLHAAVRENPCFFVLACFKLTSTTHLFVVLCTSEMWGSWLKMQTLHVNKYVKREKVILDIPTLFIVVSIKIILTKK